MKQLKHSVYEKLTYQERIIASIEAKAREDDNEVQRLIKTCPKKRYVCTDSDYSDRMERLFLMQLAVECDLMRHALNYLCFTCDEALEIFANTHTAWTEFLSDHGIKLESMNKIVADMRHPMIKNMLKMMDNKPNQAYVDTYKQEMNQIYNCNL